MEIRIQSLENINAAARQFIDEVINQTSANVYAFYGKMGSGKTTFIKALCEELGVEDVITSPTFAIVNEYTISPLPTSPHRGGDCQTIYHFDFYRIRRIEEVYDMGYEDYFYAPDALCFIEWPELIEDLLPEDTIRIDITEQGDGSRLLQTR
ncbi:MAG: tRNA (adenosine(37)-N6)-threonylcarbamoyltransferase complex ATPase subunit type 1 TsaE [Prevotella sp.]|nr:tRNA (adenosine(37)-N6)-threonylcarbamoyltransferase complex ATPase subunit type 1 TsaE [Prevotella sp.]